MRAFTCPVCRQLIFFENSACLSCGARLGFVPGRQAMVALAGDGPHLSEVEGTATYLRCANRVEAGCNWLLRADDPAVTRGAGLCRSCALTRTRPADTDPAGMALFAKAEAAKRRLVFQLDEIGLPIVTRADDPSSGLAFDLLSSRQAPVTTGHDSGLITLDLAESDDAYRERTRQKLGEPYRTLLGHFRHEVGHYYWTVLVEEAGQQKQFRARFGDEREDYGQAISRHYDRGAPPDWAKRYVSEYATMHPWEDWAETFAHILHIRDTLQTAASFGLLVAGPLDERTGRRDPALASVPVPGDTEGFDAVIADWLPLTYALNAVNRSMGRDDLYPFVLAPTVIDKLTFVHGRIQESSGRPQVSGRLAEAAERVAVEGVSG